MVLAGVGAAIRQVAARGLAGSGMVLDPEKAREDIKPFSQAVGGMIQDAAEGFHVGQPAEERGKIMVRCGDCRALNPEEARYCNQCGKAL